VTCFQLTLQRGFNPGLELLDLGPLLGFPTGDLDFGLRLQALDGGIGCGGLLVDLDLRDRAGDRWIGRDRAGDRWIGRGLGWLWRRRNRGGDALGGWKNRPDVLKPSVSVTFWVALAMFSAVTNGPSYGRPAGPEASSAGCRSGRDAASPGPCCR